MDCIGGLALCLLVSGCEIPTQADLIGKVREKAAALEEHIRARRTLESLGQEEALRSLQGGSWKFAGKKGGYHTKHR